MITNNLTTLDVLVKGIIAQYKLGNDMLISATEAANA